MLFFAPGLVLGTDLPDLLFSVSSPVSMETMASEIRVFAALIGMQRPIPSMLEPLK